MHAIRQVVIFGNAQVSTQALQTLVENEIAVAYLTGYGRFIGLLQPAPAKNVGLREAQFARFADPAECLNLSKVATTCEDFGVRKQFSVFLCRLSATDMVRLRNRLYDLIDLEADRVLFLPICAKCVNAIEALGRPTEPADAKDVVIVA